MAKQTGPFFIEGTIDNVTFYKMDGVYYVRKKSSLSRKKVLKSPRFERTRQHASQLAEASRIASQVYKLIPKEGRNILLFRSLVGQAKSLLAAGQNKEVIINTLKNNTPQAPIIKESVQTTNIPQELRLFINKYGKLTLQPSAIDFFLKLKPTHSLTETNLMNLDTHSKAFEKQKNLLPFGLTE